MDNFTLKLSATATHDLDQFEDKVARIILNKMAILKENPFPMGKLIKKIKGKKSTFYRLRVDKYRVFYSIEKSDAVVILKVVGKKDADRFIKKL